MEFFSNSKFDFMGKRGFFLVLSTIAVIGSLAVLFGFGTLNLGIDFAGGTQQIIRFQEEPDVAEIRDILEQAGFEDASLQRFGEPIGLPLRHLQ